MEKTQRQKDWDKLVEIAVGGLMVMILGGIFFGAVHFIM